MKIIGIQKNSTIDFPGMLSMVVFVAGCNYSCYYCHNRQVLNGKTIPQEGLFNLLEKRIGLIDGVVISGGEPTVQPDLPEFIKKIKKLGYSIKLDTNGTNPEMVKHLINENLLDYIAIDYKAPLHKYALIEACSNDMERQNEMTVRETITMAMESDVNYEIRTTMVPVINEEDIIYMAKEFSPFDKYALQIYRPAIDDPGETRERILYKKEDLNRLSKIIKKYQPNIIIRG